MTSIVLRYMLPNLIYMAPETIWSYIVVPIGKRLYNKVSSYVFKEYEPKTKLEHEEFLKMVQHENVRVYEIITFTNEVGQLERKYILMVDK